MIPLFHIPTHRIDTSNYSSLLDDSVVDRFEQAFAKYVGADYAVSLHSATAGIFLAFQETQQYFIHTKPKWDDVFIPSILPPVVANALIAAGCNIEFTDNVDWVGGSYILHEWENCRFIDSAQRLVRDQFKKEANPQDVMLFSFYPTKPVGSCDGGMIVSNDRDAIECIRTLANNGMERGKSSWERNQVCVGMKMYMNSIAADIALRNLQALDEKNGALFLVRGLYDAEFGIASTSNHLYRIPVENNVEFVKKAAGAGIQCGIHYKALHHNELFCQTDAELPKSDEAARTMVSIPFNEKLSSRDLETVIKFVHANR